MKTVFRIILEMFYTDYLKLLSVHTGTTKWSTGSERTYKKLTILIDKETGSVVV